MAIATTPSGSTTDVLLALIAGAAVAEEPVAVVAEEGVAEEGPTDGAAAEQGGADTPEARGAALAQVARCASCHTARGGEPYAGGYALETPYGTFFGTNLTPDPEHGIGAWSYDDFVAAMRRGRSPEGRPYYPAFPYGSFTRLTDDDLADLWAYLRTLPASSRPDTPHDLRFPFGWRFLNRGYKLLEHRVGPVADDPSRSAEWNRGRYLAEAVTHCGECHTPRNAIGGLRERRLLAGHDDPPEPGPNVTPGALSWTLDDWVDFLELGMTPDGDFVGGEMRRVVREGTALLSEADRRALAVWLTTVPPHGTRERAREGDRDEVGDEDWW